MIPSFDPHTGNLPPGVHEATWEEVVARFSGTPRRIMLLSGLEAALDALRLAGCRRVYLDGSFVSNKPDPNDYDACWEQAGVDWSKLDPVLLTFDRGRATQKAKYRGELFIAEAAAEPF